MAQLRLEDLGISTQRAKRRKGNDGAVQNSLIDRYNGLDAHSKKMLDIAIQSEDRAMFTVIAAQLKFVDESDALHAHLTGMHKSDTYDVKADARKHSAPKYIPTALKSLWVAPDNHGMMYVMYVYILAPID